MNLCLMGAMPSVSWLYDAAEPQATEVGSRVVYVAAVDVVVSVVVTVVNETTPSLGFTANPPPPEHVNVDATGFTASVTVRVRTVADVAATVTVPELPAPEISHVGGDPLTNTALSAVIVIVSETSLTPAVPVANAVTGTMINLSLVGARPTTN